jgi:hypothetical protein
MYVLELGILFRVFSDEPEDFARRHELMIRIFPVFVRHCSSVQEVAVRICALRPASEL